MLMYIRLLANVLLLASLAAMAQVAPIRITASEAKNNLSHNVQATTPPLAKAARVGGIVKIQVVISATGKVVEAKVISGHPMLVAAAIEAVKKWEYRPFEVDGKAVEVSTDVDIDFPGGMSDKESAIRNKFFPLENECRKLLNQGLYKDAEQKCHEAVDISNDLPEDVVLERTSARSLLANSIFLQNRASEAIPIYEEALKLDKGYRNPDDADLASDYWNLGRAYATIGQLGKADELYSTAISTFDAAIVNLPSMKENYSRRLKRALNEYSQVKDAEGQREAAAELRRKAEAL